MARYIGFLLLLLGCFTSCSGAKDTREASVKNGAANVSPSASDALERAAIDSGVVADSAKIAPTGLYRHRHEAGTDSLCIVDDHDGKLRFGLEAAFGGNIECHGSGTLRQAGSKLIMNFERSACIIVASYEGDRIALPGALDVECRKLCSERGSLEGISFPRVSRSEALAHEAHGRDGQQLCS